MKIEELQVHTVAEPCKVKLIRMSKGYNWELTYQGETFDEAQNTIKAANDRMLRTYGNQSTLPEA